MIAEVCLLFPWFQPILVCFQEEDGGKYTSHDLKAMIHSLGLAGRVPCDMLLTLHEELRHHRSSAGVRFSLPHLLRVTQLVVQQLGYGGELPAALYDAAIEVYVRPQRNQTLKQVRHNIINIWVS